MFLWSPLPLPNKNENEQQARDQSISQITFISSLLLQRKRRHNISWSKKDNVKIENFWLAVVLHYFKTWLGGRRSIRPKLFQANSLSPLLTLILVPGGETPACRNWGSIFSLDKPHTQSLAQPWFLVVVSFSLQWSFRRDLKQWTCHTWMAGEKCTKQKMAQIQGMCDTTGGASAATADHISQVWRCCWSWCWRGAYSSPSGPSWAWSPTAASRRSTSPGRRRTTMVLGDCWQTQIQKRTFLTTSSRRQQIQTKTYRKEEKALKCYECQNLEVFMTNIFLVDNNYASP